MLKNKIKIIIFSLIFTFVFTTGFGFIFAQAPQESADYVLLESVKDLEAGQSVTFSQYVNNAYLFILSACALLGVIMLTIAGIEYASAGLSETAKSGAKNRATSAIIGLLLALSAVLILETINPKLTTLDFSVQKSSPTINPNP